VSAVSDSLRTALLDGHGITVTELAPKLAITRPSLSKVLNGRAVLSVHLALRIETVFGIDARKLLIAQLDEQLEAARTEGDG
jgi:addiction module HigA family antidote